MDHTELQARIKECRNKFNLTERQALFAYHFTGNATESARLAGYKHPSESGYKNIRNDQIRDAIGWLRSSADASILMPEDILKAWTIIATDPLASVKDKNKALENLARSHAMFTDKTLNLNYTKSDRIDSLTDAELNKLLEQTVKQLVGSGMVKLEDHTV